MNWMNKMERKFGRYAIHNLTVVLLVCYVVGFIVSFTIPELLYYFTLEPGLILRGAGLAAHQLDYCSTQRKYYCHYFYTASVQFSWTDFGECVGSLPL